ncbi:MAG: ATP-dependent DNA helicase RecG [Actinobacteria bacterium]|nr:ATP-dependent DNA helicase RecG [Thermoleophilia bacterium]MCB9010823.1 ATP-dependent DNA helicase RecG [Actinomycetota bacterium]
MIATVAHTIPFAGEPSLVVATPQRRPGARWWDAPVAQLPGIRPAQAERATAMDLATIGALLEHTPVRYERYGDVTPIAGAFPGQEVTVRAVLHSIRLVPTRRRRLVIIRARLADQSGQIDAVWFNQRHLLRVLAAGDELLVRGTVAAGSPRSINVKAHELLGRGGSEGLHTTGLVPVYSATEALPSARIRELADLARPYAQASPERLPARVRHRLGLMSRADALVGLHAPRSSDEARDARRRMVIEELLELQLGLLALRRMEQRRRPAHPLRPTRELSDAVRAALPFTPTPEQERALREIGREMRLEAPMRRLLQGDVGSGKTLVAVLAICQAVEAGTQAAVLVPTETLAEQHLRTLDALLAPAGLTPVLLTGKVPAAERERRLMAIRTGTAEVVVGTQALLSEGVTMHRLGLLVVDEQHRFGVEQRHTVAVRALDETARAAHILYMTATPIPRTLALTNYGDLTVSSIRGRPAGRGPVTTRWVRESGREDAYADLRAELRDGGQVYVVCPLVDGGDAAEARAATQEADRLREGPFREFQVGLVHGAMKADEKRAAMEAFAAGRTDVLVATTVVEVGIDVPNASAMLIEGADRFGLAQLHQLRGRVGRGTRPGLCLLFGEPTTDDGTRRLEAITQTTDGFRLAELDLQIRGEGAVLGVRQAGPTDLRYARLARDRKPLAQARQVARRILREDPTLQRAEHQPLRQAVEARFASIPRLMDA